uniref:Non-specific lipid-transfer protein n=1 Tax=Nicotiana sylvestris TaxID=4096 RepID=A0A1U7WNF4_NICSY|nr:PREDICTED: uncharacterized protein LOC104228120 [Nicotiana sylvestris]
MKKPKETAPNWKGPYIIKRVLPKALYLGVIEGNDPETAVNADAVKALRTEALLSSDTVYSSLQPCIGYVLGGGTLPPECCSGLKSLISIAKTRPDRQSFCSCAKGAASSTTPEELARANGLAGRCHARVPFKISPDMDCSKAQQLTIAQMQSHPKTPSTVAPGTAPPTEQIPKKSSNNGSTADPTIVKMLEDLTKRSQNRTKRGISRTPKIGGMPRDAICLTMIDW